MGFMRKIFNHTVSGHRNAAADEERRTLFSRCRVVGLECSLSSRAQNITNRPITPYQTKPKRTDF